MPQSEKHVGHPYHERIGELLTEIMKNADRDKYQLVLDSACERDKGSTRLHTIPFYGEGDEKEKNRREYCDVDAIILEKGVKEQAVKIIIEIEESGINSMKVCGKVLAASLCSKCRYDSKMRGFVSILPEVTFIQILDLTDDMMKEKSTMKAKLTRLGNDIQKMTEAGRLNRIKGYHLFIGNEMPLRDSEDNDFNSILGSLIN